MSDHGLQQRIADNLAAVRERIAHACARCGRDPREVTLVAVSKRHPPEAIRAAHAAGQRVFGENYVQELTAKADSLADLRDLQLRFIGHLQRNKARDVVRVAASVDSVDSDRLAEALAVRARERGAPLEVLIQVNVDAEPQKGGVLPGDFAALAERISALSSLSLRGVMAIPAAGDPERMRPAFRALARIARDLGLPVISMGMSADLEAAIEEGSTMVRVGTAIFGPRE